MLNDWEFTRDGIGITLNSFPVEARGVAHMHAGANRPPSVARKLSSLTEVENEIRDLTFKNRGE